MRTSILRSIGLGAIAAVGLLASAEVARAQVNSGMSCEKMWYERNAIYARYGHCFQTQRAIAVFGRGCFPPYGRLPRSEQAAVNEYIYWERAQGCPR